MAPLDGVAADGRLGVGDGEVDVRGQVEADGVAVVLVQLDEQAVDEEVGRRRPLAGSESVRVSKDSWSKSGVPSPSR